MRIGITGITGLIGKKLAMLCEAGGHIVTGFSRTAHRSLPNCQNVRQFSLSQPVNVSGLDAIVHLAGERIIGLWTLEKRRRIVSSRRDSTRHLIASISKSPKKPSVFLCASGTGYYGDRGSEKLTEEARHGQGFLSEVAQVWEEEAKAAMELGIRTVSLRTGVVLAKNGGVFPLLLRVFSLGLGGKIGSGQQYMPWIHLDDIAGLYLACIENEHFSGPINAVAPEDCTNLYFTQHLARALRRPAFLNAPEILVKFLLRDLSSLVLESQRAIPQKVLANAFIYQHPNLDSAFAALIKN